MIDTANKTTREVQTPDGKGTLIHFIQDYRTGEITEAFVKIAGRKFMSKYRIGELAEVTASPAEQEQPAGQ
jgi:hypothetical protein